MRWFWFLTMVVTTRSSTMAKEAALNHRGPAPSLQVETGTIDSIEVPTIINPSDGDQNLSEWVRNLMGGLSERYVPEPSDDERTTDVINGLGDYKVACRWACLFHTFHKGRAKNEQEKWRNFYQAHPDALAPSLW